MAEDREHERVPRPREPDDAPEVDGAHREAEADDEGVHTDEDHVRGVRAVQIAAAARRVAANGRTRLGVAERLGDLRRVGLVVVEEADEAVIVEAGDDRADEDRDLVHRVHVQRAKPAEE